MCVWGGGVVVLKVVVVAVVKFSEALSSFRLSGVRQVPHGDFRGETEG